MQNMGNFIGTMMSYLRSMTNPKSFHKTLTGRRRGSHNVDDAFFFTPTSRQSELESEDDDAQALETLETSGTTGPPTFMCKICIERSPLHGSFNPKGCAHFYCTECTVRYVASKLDDNITVISCPESGCGGSLDPEYCREILPKDLFDRWGLALCESVIGGSEKFYCPYNNCSALLIKDVETKILDSVCPFCKRTFCVKCKVPWHSDIDCKKFQKMKKKGEDYMLRDLAQRKKWKRCPVCKYYVEKSSGCNYLMCRCGYAFCYRCGSRNNTTSHVCPTCKR